MQPLRALRRASALAAGVVAVLLLVCGGLFTHPASAGDAAGMGMDMGMGMRTAGPPPSGSPAMAATAGVPGPGGTPGMAGVPAMAGMPAAGLTRTDVMAWVPETAAMPAMNSGSGTGSDAGAGSHGGCSDSAQDCPLASAYASTVQAGPAGDLPGCALGGTRPAAHGRTGPAPPPDRSRPRAPDLDSLCVSRT
ncbi:hypothetical protein ACFRJ1_04220 [Streptomyces sp. NPDC056773]|uniref:hypothetical protein n=1 Tax=unclassified Streptomyces TaxID=2593676 RepID=UPI0036B3012A